MDKPFKFALPPPNFSKNIKDVCKAKPHFLTPSGMSLLPREKQPPPMYGKQGATVPGRYLQQQCNDNQQKNQQVLPNPPEKQYCEPCEQEFYSIDDLKRHRAQHEKCPVVGCTFRGHPSIMDKHINALHASGLFEKFKKLSTPEEIAAWREERRKRYPTLANVLLKQKAQEQKQKRGERLDANKSRFGKTNDRKRAQPQERNRNEVKAPMSDNKVNNKNSKRKRKNKQKNNGRNFDQTQVDAKNNEKNLEEAKDEECNYSERCGIKMFCGTSQLKDYEHVSDKKKAVKSKVLFDLVGMYGSDDEDETDEENAEDNEHQETEKENNKLVNKDASIDNINSRNDDDYKEYIDSKVETVTRKLDNTDVIENEAKEKLITNCFASKELTDENIGSLDTKDCNLKEVATGQSRIAPQENVSSNIDGNSSDEGPEETPIQRTSNVLTPNPNTATTSVSNEEPATKRTKLEEQPKNSVKQRIATKRKYGLDYRRARLRKQNTMLEKLLETDIRHERNVLLQCVRYVCENNYFGIGQNSQNNPG